MDSNLHSPPPDNGDAKTTFRKPSSDATNRKYRRRSPLSGSSSSDGNPKHDRSSSPNITRDDLVKISEHRPRRKDDGRELDRDSGRSHYGRSGDSHRHSDRQSSRSSHGYPRHDDYTHDKHVDEEERNYHRVSSRSGHESRGGTHFEHTRQESEHSRSRDYSRNVDKYSRDKYDGLGHRSKDSSSDRAGSGRRHVASEEVERDRYTRDRDGRDEKREYRRSSGDYKSDRTLSYEETRGHRNGSTSGRDSGKHHSKEAYKSDPMELDGQKLSKEEKKKYDDRETNRDKDRYIREPGEIREKFDDKCVSVSENQDSPAKKQKLYSLDKDVGYRKDVKSVSKFSTVADEKQSSSLKLGQDGKVTLGQGQANDSDAANDLNAAKVAAMKAAELVNRNLVGGVMTADQKKKLLWGNKKNTTAEEPGHRWDTTLFSDRERQEKFNKLMSLRLPWCLWPIVGCEGRSEGGTQTRQRSWKRPQSREAEGTPAGFREAVHCWTATKGWPYCWIRSLSIY